MLEECSMDGLQGKAEGEEWVVVSGPYLEQKKTTRVPPPRLLGIQVEVKYRKTYLCLPPP